MTLRDLAIVMVIALAAPAVLLILRDARAAVDRDSSRAARGMHVLWTAVPVVLLVLLVYLSVVA